MSLVIPSYQLERMTPAEIAAASNGHHFEHAAPAVELYATAYGSDEDREDHEMILSDMLADMLHYGRVFGVDPDKIISRALGHFLEEEKLGE